MEATKTKKKAPTFTPILLAMDLYGPIYYCIFTCTIVFIWNTLMHHSGSATVGDIRIDDIFQVSGRLFNSDSTSIPRRSVRLKDTATNSNSNTSQFGGNGTGHSSGKLRVNSSTPSKLCSTAIRSVQVRKGKPRATENFDEGDYHFNVDDSSNFRINVGKFG